MATYIRKARLKNNEIIPLNMDFMFTTIFNKEKNIYVLEVFLSDYLEIPLSSVKGNLKILKRKLLINNKREASNEVDLVLNYNGKLINIELSNERKSIGIIERNIVFACKIHGGELEYGNNDYKDIDDTIQINLNNFRCNKEKLVNKYYLADIENKKILTTKFRIDMVDLVLGSKMCYNINDRLSKWCRLLLTKKQDELYDLSIYLLGSERGGEFMSEVEMLCSDDEYIGLYTKLSKKELEYNTYIAEAKEEGFNNGFNNGFSSGEKSGERSKQLEIAKNLISKNVDMDFIIDVTGLTKEQISTLY